MKTVKIISLILLSIYLFFSAVFNIFGYEPSTGVNSLLGLSAIGSGILILISIREYLYLTRK